MGCAQNREKKEERVLKYLFLGLEGAGKTSVIKAYEGEPFDETPDPTTIVTIHEFKKNAHLLRAVECPGSKEAKNAWLDAYNICSFDAIVFVLDGSNPNSYEEAKEQLRNIMLSHYEDIEYLPVAVFVNKADLGTKIDSKELRALVKDAAKDRRKFASVYDVSAKTGENISKGFEDLEDHLNPMCCCFSVRYEKPKKTSSSGTGTPQQAKASTATRDTVN